MTLGPTTTAAEVVEGVDLEGSVAVVTGATGGIGLETARALAASGAIVVLGNRNRHRGELAAQELRAIPNARVELGTLDLTSLESVRSFAASVSARHDHIDVLVNNAGVMATPFERTADGFELQFGTNHLAHFLLTNLLVSALCAASSARIVVLSSAAHHMSGINWEDPNFHNSEYTAWPAYGQSKTANILFTLELQRRLGDRGVNAFAVHPGYVDTDLMRHLDEEAIAAIRDRSAHKGVIYKTPQQGAATPVLAATAPELAEHGGAYLEDCGISSDVAPHARDPADAQVLWSLSEQLVADRSPTASNRDPDSAAG